MAKNFDQGKIDFVGKIRLFAGVSAVLSVIAIGFLVFKGLNYGIDFAGGTEIQIRFQQPLTDDGQLRKFLEKEGLLNVNLQKFGEGNEYLIRFEVDHNGSEQERSHKQAEIVKNLTTGLQTEFSTQGAEIRRVDSVGPQIGDQMKRNGILALFYALIAILIYVGLRFDYEYAPGAVLCLFHDAL
jgi:preprotein translocase subunit SecF